MSADTNKLRSIAFYSPGWPPACNASGIVSYVGALREGLADDDRKTYVVSCGQSQGAEDRPHVNLEEMRLSMAQRLAEKIAGRFRILHAFSYPLTALRIAQGVSGLSSRHPIDLLEMEESFGMAYFVRRFLRIPVVVRLHGPWFLVGEALGVPVNDEYRRRIAMERLAISSADGVTSPSQAVLDAVRARFNVDLPNAVVIPNAAPKIAEARQWTLSGSDPDTVLFVGRFDRCKGGDLVIEAFNRIVEACPNTRLVFVGPDRGLRTDSGLTIGIRDFLESHASRTAKSRIEYMGQLTSLAIEELRRSARVTIMASRYENFSLALLESLAFGCPTVATNVGGIPEIIVDGKTGLLCRPNDPASLADRVVQILRNPSLAVELSQASAKDIPRRFSSRVVADQSWAYYETVWLRAAASRRKRS